MSKYYEQATFKEWFIENLLDSAEDLAQYGASGGFPGITYYTDTVRLYDQYKEEFWDWLDEDADSQGVTILELIGQFGGAKNVGSDGQFKNLITWYAAEKLAHQYVDDPDSFKGKEEDEDDN